MASNAFFFTIDNERTREAFHCRLPTSLQIVVEDFTHTDSHRLHQDYASTMTEVLETWLGYKELPVVVEVADVVEVALGDDIFPLGLYLGCYGWGEKVESAELVVRV